MKNAGRASIAIIISAVIISITYYMTQTSTVRAQQFDLASAGERAVDALGAKVFDSRTGQICVYLREGWTCTPPIPSGG